jgi:hypothetical protein
MIEGLSFSSSRRVATSTEMISISLVPADARHRHLVAAVLADFARLSDEIRSTPRAVLSN